MCERITIQRATSATDAYGGPIRTWADLRTCWARVQPVRGREDTPEGNLASVQVYLVVIRNYSGLTTGDRIVWGSTTLNIRSIENRDERGRYLTMECQAGVNSE